MGKSLDVKNKILLFDLDGTLVDTEKVGEQVLHRYCSENGLFTDPETLHQVSKMIVGRTWKAAVREITRNHSLRMDPERFENDLKFHYRELLKSGVEDIPGVHEKLLECRSQAMFMGIVTGSGQEEVELILKQQGMDSFFDQIWSSHHYTESKPSPVPFQTAFQEIRKNMRLASGFEIYPEDILVFEDSPAGMDSASRAGFAFVQILHSHPHLWPDPRALFSIKDWRELRIRS